MDEELKDPKQVADEVREMNDPHTRNNAAWTIEKLMERLDAEKHLRKIAFEEGFQAGIGATRGDEIAWLKCPCPLPLLIAVGEAVGKQYPDASLRQVADTVIFFLPNTGISGADTTA